MSMNIVFALRGLYPENRGGSSRVAYNLIKQLFSRRDVQIDVIHPGYTYCLAGTPRVKEYPMNIRKNNFRFKKAVASFLRSKESHYDCGFNDGFAMLFYVKNRGFPILYHHHSFRWFQYWDYPTYLRFDPVEAFFTATENLIRRWLTKYMIRNTDYVVSQGEQLTKLLQERFGVQARRIILAPSPPHIHMQSQQVNTASKIKNSFLFVGNLVYYKGLIHLISAFNKIESDAQLFIVGDGPLKQKLQRMCTNQNVYFLGQVTDEHDLKQWYSKCECFILPTLSEGSPLVFPEALSFGMPIIATNVGGTGQFLSSNNAIIILPGKVTDIIDAVYKFMNLSANQKDEMRRASIHIFRSLPNWHQNAEVFYNAFLRMASQRRRSG